MATSVFWEATCELRTTYLVTWPRPSNNHLYRDRLNRLRYRAAKDLLSPRRTPDLTARVVWTGLTRACCDDHSPPVCVKLLPPDKSWAGDAGSESREPSLIPLTAKHMRLVQDSSFGILLALNHKRERGMEAKLEKREVRRPSASNRRIKHVERRHGNTERETHTLSGGCYTCCNNNVRGSGDSTV